MEAGGTSLVHKSASVQEAVVGKVASQYLVRAA
jgi:hypothetical protein